VREKKVDLALIALSPRERYEASWLISSMANLPLQLYVLPDVVTETAKTVMDELDGIPAIGLTESAISGWNARIKRMMDLAICVPLLILVAPLLIVIGLLVRLDSHGPAIFKSERIGQHNRRFFMLKFRTMRVDTERRMKEMAEHTATGDLNHKRRDNPNITRLGAFLRRTSLDELPQLINIVKGDMSVVGPRPELPWIVERYRAWQYRRLLVPQGLTGWWQVNGRSNRVLHLHTQDDIFYVRNYSLWLDIKILLMTIKSVLTGRGAF
jgi:exopolysaccharide biosynthesis polyprenyl glycosylphosphotransferase